MKSNKSRSRVAFAAAAVLGLLGSGALVWNASYAAFSATTTNGANTWSSGTVSFSSGGTGTAAFTVTGLKPDNVAHVGCVNVTYTGTLASNVKLYVASGGLTGTGLGNYLNFQIKEGTGSTNASCTGFVASSTIYGTAVPGNIDNSAAQTDKTLNHFATSKTTFSTGVGTWAPSANPTTRSYQFIYSLADTNAAQGLTASVMLTWEAQNS